MHRDHPPVRSCRRTLRPDRPRERGVSLVEFSLVAPLFLLLTIGLLITTLVITNQVQLANAVRDGARIGGRSLRGCAKRVCD
jgi:Flp pilus assembly protein TadG